MSERHACRWLHASALMFKEGYRQRDSVGYMIVVGGCSVLESQGWRGWWGSIPPVASLILNQGSPTQKLSNISNQGGYPQNTSEPTSHKHKKIFSIFSTKGMTDVNRFWRLLNTKSNFMTDTSKKEYYAILKAITAGLKESGEVTLPDFGTFYIHHHKPRNMSLINSKKIVKLPKKQIVKFRPSQKLKSYVAGMEIDRNPLLQL